MLIELSVHEVLVLQCGILHQDISIKNILMYVFDYGKHCWPIQLKDPKVSNRLSAREEIIQKHKFCHSLLINFDYVKFLNGNSFVSGGEQMVCRLAMLKDLLCSIIV